MKIKSVTKVPTQAFAANWFDNPVLRNWTDPNNALVQDSSYATNTGGSPDKLRLQQFQFNIPQSAVQILGMEVKIRAVHTQVQPPGLGSWRVNGSYLSSSYTGQNKLVSWIGDGVDREYTFGGPTELAWLRFGGNLFPLTVNIVNSFSFGIEINYIGGINVYSGMGVNSAEATVWYEEAPFLYEQETISDLSVQEVTGDVSSKLVSCDASPYSLTCDLTPQERTIEITRPLYEYPPWWPG